MNGREAILPEDEVQLWWASLIVGDDDIERLRRLLTAAELARADRLRIADARRRFIASRSALRFLLGGLTQQRPEAVRFELGPRGKPRLPDAALHFNASDSADRLVIAVAAAELGVDVEILRPIQRRAAFAERICTETELAAVRRLPEQARDAALLRLWTCKEAGLKATGVGLSGGVRNVEVELDRGGSPRLVRLCGDADGWTLITADPEHSVLCTVVLPRGRWRSVACQLDLRDG